MRNLVIAGGYALAVITMSATAPAPAQQPGPAMSRQHAAVSSGAGQTSGCLQPPMITPTLPTDMASSSQPDANCFAWQQFIALNWPASTSECGEPDRGGEFGTPNDLSPVVWETYKEASEVFLPGATKPSGFCSPQALPPALRSAKAGKALKPTSHRGYKALTMPTKFAANVPLDLSSFTEAGTNGAWLTAQSGFLTMYEVRMNQDEFTYIVDNKLYDANVQAEFAASNGIQLPDGKSDGGSVGAIEVKAAWTQLDDPASWPMFKTSSAVVKYPDQDPKTVTMGLVGLHIIHKTNLGQQFIWSTFEHVANAPSTKDLMAPPLPEPSYTFYNASCNPSTDHYECQPNDQPTPRTDPYDAPVQVVRLNSIDTDPANNIAGLNQYVWGQLEPGSVFRNYQLVNVLWPAANTPLSGPIPTPLPQGDPTPSPPSQNGTEVVANTTLETYFQNPARSSPCPGCGLACLDCHSYAPVASTAKRSSVKISVSPTSSSSPGASTTSGSSTATTAPLAADYSFLFSRAQVPAGDSDGDVPAAGVGVGIAAAVAAAGALAWRSRREARA